MTGMASGYLLGQVLEEKQGEMTSLGSLVYWLAVTSNMHNKQPEAIIQANVWLALTILIHFMYHF